MREKTGFLTECLSKFKSCLFDDANYLSSTYMKRRFKPYLLLFLSLTVIYLYMNQSTTMATDVTVSSMRRSTARLENFQRGKPNAYIITDECNSLRFNVTKQKIEAQFPNYFHFLCYRTVSLNDSRIHTGNVELWKKVSANLLTFVDLWTYEIPKRLQDNELEWSFIFEDNISFNNASSIGKADYIEGLEHLLSFPEVQHDDGFVYLGICGPTFANDTRAWTSKNTEGRLFSKKGYGYCLHATAITVKRARLFWSEISSYRPNPPDAALDLQLREYLIRSKQHFFIFGSNFHFPPGTGHYGIAYQDHTRFPNATT